MILFTLLWFVILIACFFKKKVFVFYIFLLLFSILIGFRANTVGPDTDAYEQMFNSIGRKGYNGYPEPLYGYLNFFFYKIGLSFNVMQWVMSVIMLVLFTRVIVKYSPNRNASLFFLFSLFFVFYSMNVTRQMLAVAIVLYSFSLLSLKKKWGFIVCVLIASACHLSALVAFLVLFIQNMKLEGKKIYVLLLGSFMIGTVYFNDSVLKLVAGPYAKFIAEGRLGIRNDERIVLSILLVLFWCFLCIYIYKGAQKSITTSLWFRIYVLGVLVNNVTYRLEMGLRIVFYFSIVQIIIFPMFLYENREVNRFIPWCVLLGFVGIFFFVFLYNNSVGILPYSNILLN